MSLKKLLYVLVDWGRRLLECILTMIRCSHAVALKQAIHQISSKDKTSVSSKGKAYMVLACSFLHANAYAQSLLLPT